MTGAQVHQGSPGLGLRHRPVRYHCFRPPVSRGGGLRGQAFGSGPSRCGAGDAGGSSPGRDAGTGTSTPSRFSFSVIAASSHLLRVASPRAGVDGGEHLRGHTMSEACGTDHNPESLQTAGNIGKRRPVCMS